jgi:hypothetical protein
MSEFVGVGVFHVGEHDDTIALRGGLQKRRTDTLLA